jgi:hypothetical protein
MTTGNSFYKLTSGRTELIFRYDIAPATMELGLLILSEFSFPNQWGKELDIRLKCVFYPKFAYSVATYNRAVRQLKQIKFLYRTTRNTWILNPKGEIEVKDFTFLKNQPIYKKPTLEVVPDFVPEALTLPIDPITVDSTTAEPEVIEAIVEEAPETVEVIVEEPESQGLYPLGEGLNEFAVEYVNANCRFNIPEGYLQDYGLDLYAHQVSQLTHNIEENPDEPYAQLAVLYFMGLRWFKVDPVKIYKKDITVNRIIKYIVDLMEWSNDPSVWEIPQFMREILLAIQGKCVIISKETGDLIPLHNPDVDLYGLKFGKFEY